MGQMFWRVAGRSRHKLEGTPHQHILVQSISGVRPGGKQTSCGTISTMTVRLVIPTDYGTSDAVKILLTHTRNLPSPILHLLHHLGNTDQ